VHNGQLTVNTTTDLVGGYTYLPSGNLSTTLGLATHVLNAIADGQTAYNWGDHNNQNYAKESFRLEAVGSHVTVPIITKKTIIRVDNYGQHFDVEKGNNVGDELAITFCNSQGECVANGNFINDCGNQTTSETFFKNSLFWWDGGNWVQAI
ncbi:MAG TPA: hypothetical protein VLY87_07925, partial [Flavobacterium sp.]|nr:hypothetical protein [Flavobacterium sp.]